MLTVASICHLRTEFEELTESFSIEPYNGSCINTLEWFVENGHRSNSLRSGYERAKEIAVIITEEYYGSKETGTWVSSQRS